VARVTGSGDDRPRRLGQAEGVKQFGTVDLAFDLVEGVDSNYRERGVVRQEPVAGGEQPGLLVGG
jgi:hypothetical protein